MATRCKCDLDMDGSKSMYAIFNKRNGRLFLSISYKGVLYSDFGAMVLYPELLYKKYIPCQTCHCVFLTMEEAAIIEKIYKYGSNKADVIDITYTFYKDPAC